MVKFFKQLDHYPFMQFKGLTLDDFQVESIHHIEDNKSVVVKISLAVYILKKLAIDLSILLRQSILFKFCSINKR